MKILHRYGILLITSFLLINNVKVYSQVPVEISSEKVVIAGNQYYIHTVKKGQTPFSITRAYGITYEELFAENPSSVNGIKEGQTLKIPVKSPSKLQVKSQVNTISKDENRYNYHKLKPGETIFSLSRLYGVSESEIIQSNQGIEINKMPVGSEIVVPKREFMTPKETFTTQDTKYYYHKVEEGESLSSIARKYGLTLREIRKENKNVRFPQVGDFVQIPATAVPEITPVRQVITDTVAEIKEDTVPKLPKPEGFTKIGKLEGSFDIAVILPFYLEENSQRTETESDEWIYPQSLDFLEMYNGILIAADTLRSLGLDINISTFEDIRNDTLQIKNLINSSKLDNADLIIGPVFSRNLHILSKFASEHGIPVVSPVPLIDNAVLEGNPTTFMANPSLQVAQKALAGEIADYYNSNLVFIHADSTRTDNDVKTYRNLIFSELNKKTNYEDLLFKELIFYPRSAFGNDSINRISHSLSDNHENIVIIASEDPPVVSEVLSLVYNLSKKFKVKVFGYPSMMYLDNLEPRMFFELNQMILSPYRISYQDTDVRQFNFDYLKKFLTMPVETSYAWIGYDIGYYFISGIAVHGRDFIEHPEIHNPKLLQNEFIFERDNNRDGFENKKLFRLRYTRTYDVIEEK